MPKQLFTATCLSCLILTSAPVSANASESEDDSIERISVYAQKRLQPVQDVSVAVTVLDTEQLERQHVKDTTQLAALVPNFKASNVAGEGTTPSFNIRGIGMFDYNTSSVSPVAVYSDEVVSGGANFLATNLFDLERVEVLRGPQGTLFGRNTTGGAVLLSSNKPQPEFGGYISAALAEHQHRSVQGALNLPLTEDTGLRLAVNHLDYEYAIDNLLPGGQNGGMQQTGVRMILSSEWEKVSLMLKLNTDHWQGAPKPVYSAGIIRDLQTGELCPPAWWAAKPVWMPLVFRSTRTITGRPWRIPVINAMIPTAGEPACILTGAGRTV